MKTIAKSLVLTLIAGAAPLSNAAVSFYVSDNTRTFGIIDVSQPRTTAFTTIGTLPVRMSDLAMSPQGILYGVSYTNSPYNSKLYTINPADATVTQIGDIGYNLNALTFKSDGTLYGAGNQTFVRIDTGTGVGTYIGSLSGYYSSGDLAFNPAGTSLFFTAKGTAGFSANYLSTVNLNTGVATHVSADAIGNDSVYGLDFGSDGGLYGFTQTGSYVMSIDPLSGIGSIVYSMSFSGSQIGAFDGATAVPEPSMMSYAIGAIALALIRRKRS